MTSFAGFDSLTAGQEVRVYMGAGWSKGTIVDVQDLSVGVKLASDGRRIRVYDPRNVRRA
jgi:sRNA-binding protein